MHYLLLRVALAFGPQAIACARSRPAPGHTHDPASAIHLDPYPMHPSAGAGPATSTTTSPTTLPGAPSPVRAPGYCLCTCNHGHAARAACLERCNSSIVDDPRELRRLRTRSSSEPPVPSMAMPSQLYPPCMLAAHSSLVVVVLILLALGLVPIFILVV